MQRRFDDARDAVSDVVGNVLILGMTVIVTAAFGAAVLSMPGAVNLVHADLVLRVDPGPNLIWGDSDDRILLEHIGGEPLLLQETTILLRIGTEAQRIPGDSLGGPFIDGSMGIGETWVFNRALPPGTEVGLDVVNKAAAGSSLAFSAVALSGGT